MSVKNVHLKIVLKSVNSLWSKKLGSQNAFVYKYDL